MLREKDLDARPLRELALPLLEICGAAERPLLINERVDVALSLPGVGAHVGVRGLPVSEVRGLLGPDRLLGYSAHSAAEAEEALKAGADYVTLSPIFPSRSKPDLEPRGPELLRDAAKRIPPERILALGGLTAERLHQIRETGVGGAAVMGVMMQAPDPAAAARELVRAWAG